MNPVSMLGWFGLYWLITAIATAIVVDGKHRAVTLFDILQGALWSTPIFLVMWGICNSVE